MPRKTALQDTVGKAALPVLLELYQVAPGIKMPILQLCCVHICDRQDTPKMVSMQIMPAWLMIATGAL